MQFLIILIRTINEIKKSAEKIGFKIIKKINESHAAVIGYADMIKSDKEKKF